MLKGAVYVSRISSKGQVTLPKMVRDTIGVRSGDTVVYELAAGVVTLRRVTPLDVAFHQAVGATLDEWASPEDHEAFDDL